MYVAWLDGFNASSKALMSSLKPFWARLDCECVSMGMGVSTSVACNACARAAIAACKPSVKRKLGCCCRYKVRFNCASNTRRACCTRWRDLSEPMACMSMPSSSKAIFCSKSVVWAEAEFCAWDNTLCKQAALVARSASFKVWVGRLGVKK